MTAPAGQQKPAAAPAPGAAKPDPVAAVDKLCRTAVANTLATLRKLDADAANDIDGLRRKETGRPSIVVVGETKRGKSSLTNALVGVPGLSPVDAAVATSAYMEFIHADAPRVRAFVPGNEVPTDIQFHDILHWGTVLGQLPPGMRPPRRLEISHPAPLLKYLHLVDTPGVGGLDPAHAEVALDAVERATALLFVVDASAPFSKPELDFLVEASKRVNFVLFAMTKIDAYPGWKTIMEDNKSLLQAHAPRFAQAPFYPVSARLAEMAIQMPPDARQALVTESRISELQHGLIKLASRGGVLQQTNILRALRSEFIRLRINVVEDMKSADPDPSLAEKLKEDRKRVMGMKRSETKQTNLALRTEIQRARVEANSRLRSYIQKLQEELLNKVEKADRGDIKKMPEEVDRALHALSVRLSQELEYRFKVLAERVLSQIFEQEELHQVVGRINAQLRMGVGAKPRRETNADNLMLVTGVAGTGMMAGRLAVGGATAGLGALGIGGAAAIAIPVVGIGLGLAAGAFMLYKRKVQGDRQQARVWIKEVLGETRASLMDELQHRFAELDYVFNIALDEALEKRGNQLDKQIADTEKALLQDKETRGKKKAALQKKSEALAVKIKQVDEVLAKTRAVLPAAPAAKG
ncbi:dynamin [Actinorhabdospora filicis]|uniref:Dynamin n=1 Tax=Actinorhabdospora filicis TaxID=1785913 RepID=A0A9W6SMZ8_9ACTN|nr:dynamin family protein [Actinorhabdospora filicis]GLZ79188.1 dynamin [Actinorhabdospora filicis]